jgi:xylan 1,4-beta-xylosidase
MSRCPEPALVYQRSPGEDIRNRASNRVIYVDLVRSYQNPILPGFYPDPSLCRVGGDYYLVTSSFEYFPGVPLFHSRDLVHWEQVGHVLTRRSQLDLSGVPSSAGVYAATLRHHGGRFYLVTTLIGGGGNFYVTARRPEGPWSDPIWLDRDGIDPSFLFTEAGAYYTRNGKGADFDHPVIHQATFDERITSRPRVIWRGTGGVWPEAPHLYRRGDLYYLVTAEGGTEYGHSVMVARSRSPFGPFEGCPTNPVLTHRGRRHPIQATGHTDFVDLPDGSTWAVLLGIRPKGGRHHLLGRETFLAPVTWTSDGWPRIGPVEIEMPAPPLAPCPVKAPPERDDFDARDLAPAYVFLRNPDPRDHSLSARPGHLRLCGSAVTLDEVASPAVVLRRQQHHRVRCRTSVEFDPRQPGEAAGLTVRANEDFRYDLSIGLGARGREVRLLRRVRGVTRVVRRMPIGKGPVCLEVVATDAEYAFRAGVGRRLQALGSLRSRELSAETI